MALAQRGENLRHRLFQKSLAGLQANGVPGWSTLMRLKSITTDLRHESGDAKLDTVLAEIDLRVAVEIAKLTPR